MVKKLADVSRHTMVGFTQLGRLVDKRSNVVWSVALFLFRLSVRVVAGEEKEGLRRPGAAPAHR